MRTLKVAAFIALTATCALAPTMAPGPAAARSATLADSPGGAFDAAAKRQAIEAAARLLVDAYVYPDVGARAAAMLTQNLAAGKYDAAAMPADLADQLTKDLQDLTHDKHLRVRADVAPPRAPSKGASAGPPRPLGLYGFAQTDRLRGNIGFIVLNGFFRKPLSRRGADKAMTLIASSDALIIDMRKNGGGDPAAVAYLVSFFFDAKTPVHVNDLLFRKAGTQDYDRTAFSTEPTPVGYLGKPVYVITGPGTFSGGEEFCYDMQALKRGTLIGQVTGGGANPGEGQPIGAGLNIFMPTGRAENPITHTNWEGTGVQPDIAVPGDQGFATAYALALRTLGRQSATSGYTAEAVAEAHLLVVPRKTPAPESEVALRQWQTGMADGHPPFGSFSDDMVQQAKDELPFLQAEFSRRGALQSLAFTEVDVNGGDVYDATFADKSKIQFTIVLSPDGKTDLVVGQPY